MRGHSFEHLGRILIEVFRKMIAALGSLANFAPFVSFLICLVGDVANFFIRLNEHLTLASLLALLFVVALCKKL